MGEPATDVFFYARDALLGVLIKRPLSLLNLLRTNKQIASFFAEFDSIWRLSLDYVVEKEAGQYYSEVYPFFLVQSHRTHPPPTEEEKSHKWYLPRHDIGREPYSLVYYDEVMTLSVDLLFRIQALQSLGKQPNYNFLLRSERLVREIWSAIFKTVDAENNGSPVYFPACLITRHPSPLYYYYSPRELHTHFAFLLHYICDHDRDIKAWDARNGDSLNRVKHRDWPVDPEIADAVGAMREIARNVVAKLIRLFIHDNNTSIQLPSLRLNKDTAKPYHALVFDKEHGLYNTTEKQKALLLEVLRDLLSTKRGEYD